MERGRVNDMKTKLLAAAAALALGGCAATAPQPAAPTEVRIIAFNDFHGNLEPPRSAVTVPATATSPEVRVPAGGAAYLASAIESLRARSPNHVVVAAGDMIGASPLVSSMFLDEPTIHAMNLIRVDFNAVGNHEFDRGRQELLRMQNGGCERFTERQPCRLEPFAGARFNFLAANVLTESGQPLFPAYGIRSYGSGAREVKVAFIGMTLEDTPTLVTPSGVEGLRFLDEADTVNALVPQLRAQGVDAIVVLIHQGGAMPNPAYATRAADSPPIRGCDEMDGDLMPVLARLDPAVDLVVSGHTHNAYICDYSAVDPSRRLLVTSAGRYGTLVTDIGLGIDPDRGIVSRSARNLIVQGEAFRASSGEVPLSDIADTYPRNAEVAALVEHYRAAAEPLAARVIGRFTGPATREQSPAGETVMGNLIADSQLTATAAPEAGGAQIAFMNGSGVRAEIVPAADGSVTYGQIFAAQPFGNSIVVKTFTGAQLRRLLEQQFASGWNTVERPNMLMVSRGLTYAFDLGKPEGQRILHLRLNGQPIRDDARYRAAMNSFLATGGDNFTVFREGTDVFGGPQDLDAIEGYIAASSPLTPPAANRIENRTPR
jgi:5'-nucleotidase